MRPETCAISPQDVGPYRQIQLEGQAAGAAAYAEAVPSPDSLMARMCQVRNREQGKEGEPLTDVQINSQSFTFILAGEKSGPGPELDLQNGVFKSTRPRRSLPPQQCLNQLPLQQVC